MNATEFDTYGRLVCRPIHPDTNEVYNMFTCVMDIDQYVKQFDGSFYCKNMSMNHRFTAKICR